MQPALLIRLRPSGPWRYGPSDGGHDRTDTLYRSDRLFSALTIAAKQLGFLDEWLDATVRGERPAFAVSSLFPFQGDTLYAPPPATLWPPPAAIITSPSPVFLSKIRWTAAKFVPLPLIESILLSQRVLADQWAPDPESGCLLRRDRPSTSPFRAVIRSGSAVDRISQSASIAHATACVEFETGAGLWSVVRFADEATSSAWSSRLEALFRLLTDTGLGGRRSSGWGQSQAPEIQKGPWPQLVLPKLGRALDRNTSDNQSDMHWLLSLFSPSLADHVDWTRGDYAIVERGGFTDVNSVAPAPKKRVRMVAEGSVLSATEVLKGKAVNVAPDGFAHPVYRSGIALALNLPIWHEPTAEEKAAGGPVETASDPDAVDERPCDEPRPEPEFERQPEPKPELEAEREPELEFEWQLASEGEQKSGTEFESHEEPELGAEPVSEFESQPPEEPPAEEPNGEL